MYSTCVHTAAPEKTPRPSRSLSTLVLFTIFTIFPRLQFLFVWLVIISWRRNSYILWGINNIWWICIEDQCITMQAIISLWQTTSDHISLTADLLQVLTAPSRPRQHRNFRPVLGSRGPDLSMCACSGASMKTFILPNMCEQSSIISPRTIWLVMTWSYLIDLQLNIQLMVTIQGLCM